MGRSGVDRASSSDARGPGFEPRPLCFKKYPEAERFPEEPGAPPDLGIENKGAGSSKKKKNRKHAITERLRIKIMPLEKAWCQVFFEIFF